MDEHFKVTDEQLSVLKDQVVVLTGCSSGIGLATTNLLLCMGAKVVGGDLKPPQITHENFTFQTTDVTSWTDITSLFKHAHSTQGGRVDHAFANAGIGSQTNYLDLAVDNNGELIEPEHKTLDINLRGVINTSAIAIHYMRTQHPPGGSVVVTASASSFLRFRAVAYASAKHGVLGFMRGMTAALKSDTAPVRINAIAPSWTITGMMPAGVPELAGRPSQPPEAVARSAAILMADRTRNGQLIYSAAGEFKEIDEAVLLTVNNRILGGDIDEDAAMEKMASILNEMRKAAESS